MYSSFKFSFLFFIFFIFIGEVGAVDAIKVNDKTQKIDLSLHSDLFIDAQNHFSYEGISATLFNDNFKPANLESISADHANETVWMRFNITNDGQESFSGKIEIPMLWIDAVDIYLKPGEELRVENFSSASAFEQREIYARSFFLPISIKPSETATVYMKIKGWNSVSFIPVLYSQNRASERLTYVAMFNGALIGIILIMLLYNLNNYVTLRDKNYLYYMFYLLGLLFLMGGYYGYNFQLFWKLSPEFNTNISVLSIAFSFFTALLFTRSFLDVNKNLPKNGNYLIILIILSAVLGLSSLMVDSKPIITYALAALGALTFSFLIYISAFSMKNKLSGSNYLLFAWLFLAIGELISFMMFLGYISYSDYVYDSFALIVVLNILMISFALVSRIKDVEMQCEFEVKKEHELADRLNMSKKELRELNEKLQRKVDRHEHELFEKNKESERFLIKDDITGLYNKTKLEEILTNELHRTKRYDYKFSVIVINIDGLKKINDTHGFEVGNSLMKEMADLFMRHIRYLDTVGRWSDKEYLVVCPETDADGGLVAAQHLQKLVEQNKFFFVGTATASFGVASSHPNDTLQDMMKRAYDALSIAKESGRNRAEVL